MKCSICPKRHLSNGYTQLAKLLELYSRTAIGEIVLPALPAWEQEATYKPAERKDSRVYS